MICLIRGWILWKIAVAGESALKRNDGLYPLEIVKRKGKNGKWAGPKNSQGIVGVSSSGTPSWKSDYDAKTLSHYSYGNSENKLPDIKAYAKLQMAQASKARVGFIFAADSSSARKIRLLDMERDIANKKS